MANFIEAAVGIIVVILVAGGLLYMFYARTNAVQKNGYGALIMLGIVSLMIPVFWISESGNQAQAVNSQFLYAVSQGQQLYSSDCTDQCYAIKNNQIVNPKYNGYTIDQLNALTDDQLTRIISAGIYNPDDPHQPVNQNAVPKSDQYGGGLLSNDVDYLRAFIRSASPAYLRQQGYKGVTNGFTTLASYLQANNPSQYQIAIQFGQTGQFGAALDETKTGTVNLTMQDPGKNGAACDSKVSCFTPINIKVRVGTVITWTNQSSQPHTVTAITGTNTASPTAAPQIFDSAHGSAANLIPTGGSFSYKVTQDAYNFNPDHTVFYYCRIHTDMLAELTIVQ